MYTNRLTDGERVAERSGSIVALSTLPRPSAQDPVDSYCQALGMSVQVRACRAPRNHRAAVDDHVDAAHRLVQSAGRLGRLDYDHAERMLL